jgi:hypothetical protein
MRYLLILALSLSPAALLCQTSSSAQNLPPGFIDGSKNPALIPDYASYRLVLLSLRLRTPQDPKAISRQNIRLARIGLSGPDTQALLNIVGGFGASYSQWLTAAGSPHDSAAEQLAQSMVLATRDSILKNLTPGGASNFARYVEREKVHMVVKP